MLYLGPKVTTLFSCLWCKSGNNIVGPKQPLILPNLVFYPKLFNHHWDWCGAAWNLTFLLNGLWTYLLYFTSQTNFNTTRDNFPPCRWYGFNSKCWQGNQNGNCSPLFRQYKLLEWVYKLSFLVVYWQVKDPLWLVNI